MGDWDEKKPPAAQYSNDDNNNYGDIKSDWDNSKLPTTSPYSSRENKSRPDEDRQPRTFPHHHHNTSSTSSLSSRDRASTNFQYSTNNITTTPASYNTAGSRLSLISRHLQPDGPHQLNTPYSTERNSLPEEEFDSQVDSLPSDSPPSSSGTRTPPTPIEQEAQSPDLQAKVETQPQLPEDIFHQQEAQQETSQDDYKQVLDRAVEEDEAKEESAAVNYPVNMSSQETHPTVLIPGPIEYDDQVLKSMAHFSQSHVGQPFVDCFGEVLTMLRSLFQTTNEGSQPFVLSGSGTLGWDQVAANLTERGDEALVLHSGYFGDSFADCFETYGVKATQLKAPIGDRPQLPEIEEALKQKKYKVLTVTHVDTSTGVLSEVKNLTQMVRRVSPETLVIVDGVCSVGAEEIRFDEWDLDLVMTASQKAIGCPAGLSIIMASERAINVFKSRGTPPSSYFASWKNWLPIMQNYEAKKPSYFATPSPQLIHALHTALTQILAKPLSERFAQHKAVSEKIKAHVTSLGLKQLASDPANQSSAMTAIYLPDGVAASEFLPGILKRGVVFAGGLHKDIATKYIRFGHMGVSVMNPDKADIDKALKALSERLQEVESEKK